MRPGKPKRPDPFSLFEISARPGLSGRFAFLKCVDPHPEISTEVSRRGNLAVLTEGQLPADPFTLTTPLTVSGALAPKDIKRLTSLTRASVVGPTATYYAGVTAPVISAAMAIFSKSAFQGAGFSDYWTFTLSALLAAVAGIVWYLIFMRWSYRHTVGRGRELSEPTHISACPEALSVRRGPIETRIGWEAVTSVHVKRGYIAVLAEGADALVIPDRWFGKDGDARKAFLERLSARGDA